MNLKSVFLPLKKQNHDEELIQLREDLSKNYILYLDNLTLINRMSDLEKKNISDFLINFKHNFINNPPRNQEINRIKFISSTIKRINYLNHFDIYIDNILRKTKKSLFSNKNPIEVCLIIIKLLTSKKNCFLILLKKLNFRLIKTVLNGVEQNQENYKLSPSLRLQLSPIEFQGDEKTEIIQKIDKITLKIKEISTLITSFESINFNDKYNEDELMTEKHLYELYKQQMQDNLLFFTENQLQEIIDDYANEQYITNKIRIFLKHLENLSKYLHFSILNLSSDDFQKEKNRLTSYKETFVPIKLDQITKKLINCALENGIEIDISQDNGALLLFTIDQFFENNYFQQKNFLDFSGFKFDFSQFLGKINGFKLLKSEEIKFIKQNLSENKNNFYLINRLDSFSDSLVDSWLSFLQLNEIKEVEEVLLKKSKEYFEEHKSELYLPEIFFEFYRSFLKLKTINSRRNLINILGYLNFYNFLIKKIDFHENKVEFVYDSTNTKSLNLLRESGLADLKYELKDDEQLLLRDIWGNFTLYEKTIKDFKEIITFISKMSAFLINFNQERVKIGTNIEKNVNLDNIDRVELVDLIISLHSRYILEKIKILIKCDEILDNILIDSKKNKFIENILNFINLYPKIDLFSNNIQQNYQLEINNLQLINEIFGSLIFLQKKNEQNIRNNDKNLIYIHFDKISKVFNEITNFKSLISEIFPNKSQLDLLLIENIGYNKLLENWKNIENGDFCSESIDFRFLHNDEILDNPFPYKNIKNALKTLIFQDKLSESPRHKKHSVLMNGNNQKDSIIIGIDVLEFLINRRKIRILIEEMAFLMEIFKNQQEIFIREKVRIEAIVGIQNEPKINGCFIRSFLSFEPLKFNIEIQNLKIWGNYIGGTKKLDEPILILQFIHSLISLQRTYIQSNNLYLEKINEEFINQENKINKLIECNAEYFKNIFEKKRVFCFKVLSIRRVSNMKKSDSDTNSIGNKTFKFNDFFNKGYKSNFALTIYDFISLMARENYHEIMKINTILIRNELEKLNSKLPEKNKIFKQVLLNPLRSDILKNKLLQSTNKRGSVFRRKSQEKLEEQMQENLEKNNLETIGNIGFFDEKGFSSNLWLLPSIEQISNFSTDELPKEYSPTPIEDVDYLSKQLHQKILEARGEMKSPLQNQGVNSKRQSINILTPASQIPIKKTSKKKAIWEMREFKFLKESPIKFMLYGLWHILNILNLEIFTNCLENTDNDFNLFENKVLSKTFFDKINVEKELFEDFNRNLLRISQKMEIVQDCVDNIDEKMLFFREKHPKNKEKFNDSINKYLLMLHKKKFNLLVLASIIQINDFRLQNPEKIPLFRDFLIKICFKNLDIFQNKQFQIKSDLLYEERSDLMNKIDNIFNMEGIKSPNSLSISAYFQERNFGFGLILTSYFFRIPLEIRKNFSRVLKEINWSFYILTKENVTLEDDILIFERKIFQNIKFHMKYFVLKEALMIIKGKNEGFEALELGYMEKMEAKLRNLAGITNENRVFYSDKGTRLESSKLIIGENLLNPLIDLLSNEIEKVFIRDSLSQYSLFNRKYSLFINSNAYSIQKKVIPFKINQIFSDFLQKFAAFSIKINIFKKGIGLVISQSNFQSLISSLNLSLISFLSKIIDFLLSPTYYSTKKLVLFQDSISNKWQDFSQKFSYYNTNSSELIESRLAKKSSDLLFELDHAFKYLNYMKDEEMLREHEIKKLARQDFIESIRDSKINLQNIKNRFRDYKMGMNLDLKKYINEAKMEAERMIKRKNEFRPSFLNKFSFFIKKNLDNIEKSEDKTMDMSDYNVLNDRSKLYQLFTKLRVFYALKHETLHEKITRELSQKNHDFASSEVLWNQIKELENKESNLKTELVDTEKKIAILEHKNLELKHEVREITLEKVGLYKANNLQRGKIQELEGNFTFLKRKKFIETETPAEISNRVIIKPLNSAAKSIENQKKFFGIDNSVNFDNFNEVKNYEKEKSSSAIKRTMSGYKIKKTENNDRIMFGTGFIKKKFRIKTELK